MSTTSASQHAAQFDGLHTDSSTVPASCTGSASATSIHTVAQHVPVAAAPATAAPAAAAAPAPPPAPPAAPLEPTYPSRINLPAFCEQNRAVLSPPVCNKMIFSSADGTSRNLWLMVVGGPNQRLDYHCNIGEELFVQLQGDMVLKVMEQGEPRDILIREGEALLLPGGIPHSPQRFENTLGVVLERRRNPGELDGLRYYVDKANKRILWQRYFPVQNLGVQLVPLIKEFLASEEFRSRSPAKDYEAEDEAINGAVHQVSLGPNGPVVQLVPFCENRDALVRAPIPLAAKVRDVLRPGRSAARLFNGQDFEILIVGNGSNGPALPITTEVAIWQLCGTSTADGHVLTEGDMICLPSLHAWDFPDTFVSLTSTAATADGADDEAAAQSSGSGTDAPAADAAAPSVPAMLRGFPSGASVAMLMYTTVCDAAPNSARREA